MYSEIYQKWLSDNEKVESLDQVIFVLLNEITKKSLLDEEFEDFYDEEIEDISSLRDSLREFTKEKYDRNFEDVKCEEITVEFLETYRRFLQEKQTLEEIDLAAAHFSTIGTIINLSDKHCIAYWDAEIVGRYKQFTLLAL